MARIWPEIKVYYDLNAASRALAESLVDIARSAIAEKGYFTLALAGGNTPRYLYNLLATEYIDQISWAAVHFFWLDERYVPQDHPDSNFAMAFDTLISKVPIPPENIHPIPTEIEPLEKAAALYEQYLRKFFHSSEEDVTTSIFDLILLGVGDDGHTASLFPNDSILKERKRWVTVVNAPHTAKISHRITLTFSIVNRANYAFFLVSGDKKKMVVRSILNDFKVASKLYPAAMVHPRIMSVWFIDSEAAGTSKKEKITI